jgi:hypothetical protein
MQISRETLHNVGSLTKSFFEIQTAGINPAVFCFIYIVRYLVILLDNLLYN